MSMRFLRWSELGAAERRRALSRPQPPTGDIGEAVAAIIREVREDGDEALLRLTERFDGCRPQRLAVDESEMEAASERCDPAVMGAIRDAAGRIRAFHSADIPRGGAVLTAPGMRCEFRYQAIDPVGLYVPGGSAPLVSTILMLGVPASLAGCRDIVLCSPPGSDGEIAPEMLAAARFCGISKVIRSGGAQAIAAMAFGTESIPRCNKLFGPGNAWVTEAKKQVSMDPAGAAVDMPAGPSELVVIADGSADAEAVAWDLLSQAEHGPDSQVILLTDDETLATEVANRLGRLAATLPRSGILGVSLAAGRIVLTDNLDQAVRISNRYAPEHLIINAREAHRLAEDVRHAGSVFIGPWTPESLGDYCSGTNHVLPTHGWARACGALSVADFMRRSTFQEASFEALSRIGPTAETLARFEGLDAHRQAVRYRLETGGAA